MFYNFIPQSLFTESNRVEIGNLCTVKTYNRFRMCVRGVAVVVVVMNIL